MTTATRNGHARRPKPDDAPPHSTEAERGVLGSVLLDPGLFPTVAAIVGATDFFSPGFAAIFRHLTAIAAEGRPCDAALLIDRLRQCGELDALGGVLAITEIVESVPIAANAEWYARTVRDLSTKRQAIAINERATARIRNGESPAIVLAEQHHEIEQLHGRMGGRIGAAPKFRRITAAEFVGADYRVPYVVDGLLAARQPCAMLGPLKGMKTSLAMALALAIATGGAFLGRFRANGSRRVFVVSGESGLGTLQETFIRQCDASFVDPASVDTIEFCDTLPQFKNPVDIADFRKTISDGAFEVVFLDPLYLCADVDGREGSLFAMGAQLRIIAELCQSLGVTLIILHHLRKSVANPFEPGELSDASWAGIGEFARQWLIVNRREKYEVGTGIHRLWLSVGGSAGHSGLYGVDVDEGVGHGNRHWDVAVMHPDEIRCGEVDRKAQHREREVQDRVVADLKLIVSKLMKFPTGETRTVLRDHSGLSMPRINAAIAAGLESGAVETCKVDKNGRAEDGFRIAESGGEL